MIGPFLEHCDKTKKGYSGMHPVIEKMSITSSYVVGEAVKLN